MYWQGTGSAKALAYGEVAIGMKFVQGPQYPYNTNPGTFVAGSTYTITGTYHQPDAPPVTSPYRNSAPTPWDGGSQFANTTDAVDFVSFDTALNPADAFPIGSWTPTTFLANAYRIA